MSSYLPPVILIAMTLLCGACSAQTSSQEQQTRPPAAASNPDSHEVYIQALPWYDPPDTYSNSWHAYPLDLEEGSDSRSFMVVRDGKDANLTAKLTLDCTTKTSNWDWGLKYESEVVDEAFFSDSEQGPPKEVVANIINRYCK